MKRLRKELIVWFLKVFLYATLFGVFIGFFGLRHSQLTVMSRTLVVTFSAFYLTLSFMLSIYGGLQIGEEKSKPIIFSLGIGVFITTIITYISLIVMNTNPNNNRTLIFTDFDLLFYTLCLQILIIIVMSYFGNYLFFKNVKPSNVVVVNNDPELTNSVRKYLMRYKKQYLITEEVQYTEGMSLDHFQNAEIIVAVGVDTDFLSILLNYGYINQLDVFYNENIANSLTLTKYEIFGDILMAKASFKPISATQAVAKRLMDIVVSGIGIIITLPIMIVVAIAIKLEDGGPIFFKQARVGRNGSEIRLIKFRSMKVDAGLDPVTKNDSRVTKVGRIIRKLRIDEIPQFINILLNDMSVVGPRPESFSRHIYSMDLVPEFEYRLRVKSGLTGYAQIYGKYNTSPRQKLLLDLVYINNFSIWNDIKLIFLTLTVFFKSDSTEGFD